MPSKRGKISSQLLEEIFIKINRKIVINILSVL
ncbi:hypothetical protein CTO_0975 [Chlamydia trachomatis A2497]|uniref:Uncharacterized protein n=1 Tax=Chlamydia trachomatis serovar A (strain A2497) TaxID=580047 RepID=G4NNH7_CHLT4|nr:hypothetical protein CTO_0975 [Chlamydia trachomatis A2497]